MTNLSVNKENELLKEYIVLRNNQTDEIGILKRDSFEECRLSKCYDALGWQLGSETAGDYCLDHYETRGDLQNILFADLKKAGFDVNENSNVDDFLKSDNKRLSKFIEKWKEEHENYNTCIAYTYWDSTNFRSVIIDVDDECSTHTECEKEESIQILKEFVKINLDINDAKEIKKVDNYEFIITRYAADPFLASVCK